MSNITEINYAFKQVLNIHPKVYYDGISLWRMVDARIISGIEGFDGEMVLQEFRGFNRFRDGIAINQRGIQINPYQHWGFRCPEILS